MIDEDIGPEDDEDIKMDGKVWRVILHQSDDNDSGVLDSFKLYI